MWETNLAAPGPAARQTESMADETGPGPGSAERALSTPVFCDGEYRPFRELGPAESRLLAEQLRSAGSWGPLSRVAGVAQAWLELAEAIEESGGERVGELASEQVVAFARRLWIVPPPGGLL